MVFVLLDLSITVQNSLVALITAVEFGAESMAFSMRVS